MKNFFKDKILEDYLFISIVVILVLGAILFVVGYYWSFNFTIVNQTGIGEITYKTNLHKLTTGKDNWASTLDLFNHKQSIFTLMGNIDSNYGSLYGMTITTIIGFALFMLVILMIIIIFVWGLIAEIILPRIKKK